MKKLRLHEAASAEYLEAVRWYRARNADAARRFRRAVGEAVATLQENAGQWPLAPSVQERLCVRRVVVDRFPYAVVFMEVGAEVVILAIAHGRRRPGYWRHRVPPTP